jgi:hypothetical protein
MKTELRPIPRHEPELIQAEADRLYRGDTDKVATTSLQGITVDGVWINSRYRKAEELETMRDMILALGPLRTHVNDI